MSSTNVVLHPGSSISNVLQAQVYGNVIEATVNASSQDFIDSGLSLDVLESLRLVSSPSLEENPVINNLDVATEISSIRSSNISLAT